jgi:hypothetical protein
LLEIGGRGFGYFDHQTEVVSRRMAGDDYFGMFGFVLFNFSEVIAGSAMYQQLALPVIKEGIPERIIEHAMTLGLSYYPFPGHRIRFEYSDFTNSSFYKRMLIAKWTFCVSVMD